MESSPHEAVGMLVGRNGIVFQVEPLTNIVPQPDSTRAFMADPYEQFLAERRIAVSKCELVGFYHSHPDGAPAPSAEDLEGSLKRPCVHVIVAFATSSKSPPRFRAFGVCQGKVTELLTRVEQ
jgi:proteasome lid subunit RPN8/RPN11